MRLCDRCKTGTPAQKIQAKLDDVTSGRKSLIEEDFDLCVNCVNWLKSQVYRIVDWRERLDK